MREKILIAGETNVSKTLSLISLAVRYAERKVVIFDPDDGVTKTYAELGVELPNLTVIPVTQDWERLMVDYNREKANLAEGDWLCFDMLGRFWDLAQNYYSRTVYGMSHIEHLMMLKKLAQSTAFSGFDGLTDWPLIKNLHNTDLVEDAVLWSPFNVMCTTSTAPFSPKEKVPTEGQLLGVYASQFGIKPEGEKHNIYRFDTQAVLYRKFPAGSYHFRMVRDRGRNIDINQEFDITGKNFTDVYMEHRGIE